MRHENKRIGKLWLETYRQETYFGLPITTPCSTIPSSFLAWEKLVSRVGPCGETNIFLLELPLISYANESVLLIDKLSLRLTPKVTARQGLTSFGRINKSFLYQHTVRMAITCRIFTVNMMKEIHPKTFTIYYNYHKFPLFQSYVTLL